MKKSKKDVLVQAVARKKSLEGANLRGAYLEGANLRGANLEGANLYGAKAIASIFIPGMSSRGDYVYAVRHADAIMIKAGCWWGTLKDTRARVAGEKGDTLSGKLYLLALDLFEVAFSEKEQ